MNFAAKLRLIALLPLLLAMGIGALLWTTNRTLNAVIERERVADAVVKETFTLNTLTFSYLQHHGAHFREQWLNRHARVGALLASATFPVPPDQRRLQEARTIHQRIGEEFRALVACAEAIERQPDQGEMLREQERRRAGQLLTESQNLMSLARQLADSCDIARVTTHQQNNVVVFLLVVLTAAALATVSLVISRSITGPIARLRAGTEIVGRGYLDHRIGSTARDEIGQLGRAFDRMTEQLKTVTVSRDELVREISERQRTEQKLQQTAAALARSNSELQQFAYVASHDLREPLRMIARFVQLLQRRYQGQLDADADKYIGFAMEGAQRLQLLIDDLLEFARLETRAKPFALIDCQRIAQVVLDNLQIAIAESGATVTVAGPLPTVLGDDTQLTQLFQNLVSNALKFRRPETPPQIQLGAQRDGSNWLFHVRDNGIGIDPQYHERIFVIFQRLHTREQYPGTGIGLALCKKIVERHGGRIWVESALGQGATFWFTLPAV